MQIYAWLVLNVERREKFANFQTYIYFLQHHQMHRHTEHTHKQMHKRPQWIDSNMYYGRFYLSLIDIHLI